MAFPSVSQVAETTAAVLVKKVGGDDAICPEMPKLLTRFAPGRQQPRRLRITDEPRPVRTDNEKVVCDPAHRAIPHRRGFSTVIFTAKPMKVIVGA
jgi:hypothetical protein